MKNKIIWFDLETTGLNPFHQRIIEISAKDNFGNVFNSLLKIDQPLDAEIIRITKITDEMLNTEGRDYNTVLHEFNNFILGDDFRKYNRIFMVAHNGDSFDRMFLKTQFKKLNIKFTSNTYFIDTLHLSRLLHPKIFSHSMASLCKYFNVANNNPHRAEGDVDALIGLWNKWMIEFDMMYGKNDPITIYNTIYL